jgi:hypothetical protein
MDLQQKKNKPDGEPAMKKILGIFSLMILLNGCGPSVSKVSFVRPDASVARSYTVADARPEHERASAKGVVGTTTLHFLGDDAVTPSVPELLDAALSNHPSLESQKPTVVMKSIRVVVESPYSKAGEYDQERFQKYTELAQSQAGSVGYGSALGGAILVDLLTRAFERTNDITIHTVSVNIEGSVDGIDFTEYAFSSYDSGNGESQIKEAISEAIDKTASAIVRLSSADKTKSVTVLSH